MYLCLNKYKVIFQIPKNWYNSDNKRTGEWKKFFLNSKIEQFINRISLESFKIIEGKYPALRSIISYNHFLIRFPIRLISFKTSFDSPTYKSLFNLRKYENNFQVNSKYSATLKKHMRIKINIDRDKILEEGFNIMKDENISTFRGYLEFEYKEEIGNGLGPTLEFYTLIINKIQEQKHIWYKTTDGSLYPRLLNENDNNEEVLQLFKLLGFIIGRAIFDDRLLDVPLNKVFWDHVLGRPILVESIKSFDNDLGRTIRDFFELMEKKKVYIIKNNITNEQEYDFDDKILYNNCRLSELDIYFIFPGYNDIELKPNGSNILLTMNNIEEYVQLIYEYIFYKGINKIAQSFKEGFNKNFNIEKLRCFNSGEIKDFICGNLDEKWDKNILMESLKPEHGYTAQSKTFIDLINFMSSLDRNQRKQFLIFSTGCSRLPIGGFKALTPKLTVVKKHCEEDNDPDDYLPTVMTCQNYLKIPEYSTYNILEKKILLAMSEGCNEFNLS
jgi:E3 ubiquitin-protein ligase TRIP12